jgi:hypothetical protein
VAYEIKLESGACVLTQDGAVIRTFAVTADFARGFQITETINQLRTATGLHLYESARHEGISYWSLYQEEFFWRAIRPVVKYSAVLRWWMESAQPAVQTPIQELTSLFAELTGLATGRAVSIKRRLVDLLQLAGILVNNVIASLLTRITGTKVTAFGAVPDTTGANFRLRDLYAELDSKGIRFIHSFAFSGFKAYFRHLVRYRRLCFYIPHSGRIYTALSGETVEAPMVDLSHATLAEHEKAALGRLIRNYQTHIENNMRLQGLVRLCLRMAGLKSVVGIDDHSALVALLPACKAEDVETIAMQTGPFRKLNLGWICPGIPREHCTGYDRLLVWSEYWKQLLAGISNVYSPENLEACGFIRPQSLTLSRHPGGPPATPVRLLYAWEFLADPAEVAACLTALTDRGVKVYFKLRPDTADEVQLRHLPSEKLHLIRSFEPDSLSRFDVCGGTFTTVMYELYHLGLPLWYFPMSHDYGDFIVRDGIAEEITLSMLCDPSFDPVAHVSKANLLRKCVFGEMPAPAYLASQLSGGSLAPSGLKFGNGLRSAPRVKSAR